MFKLQESNKWVVMTIAVCISIIIAAHIISNSGRYQVVPTETVSVTILDTQNGDVYIESKLVKDGKRVWIRKRLSDGVYRDRVYTND